MSGINITQEEILRSGYKLPAAPVDAWRNYDERHPSPGYFQFDWLSSRHPDLYHRFASSSTGLMEKLDTLFDLSGLDVVDIGAGTGRSAMGAARKAKRVFAVELYASVVSFGKSQLEQAKIENVHYIDGDREHLPLPESSVDVAINSWAELNPHEAFRVLKPNGTLIQLGAAPEALCGELTAELACDYPWIPKEIAPAEVFEPDYPDTILSADNSIWDGIPVVGPIKIHQFTYVTDFVNYTEAAVIFGRLYGPKAKRFFMSRRRSTFSWRLQIILGQVSK